MFHQPYIKKKYKDSISLSIFLPIVIASSEATDQPEQVMNIVQRLTGGWALAKWKGMSSRGQLLLRTGRLLSGRNTCPMVPAFGLFQGKKGLM